MPGPEGTMERMAILGCDGDDHAAATVPAKGVADRLFEKRTVVFGSEVSAKTAATVIEQLFALDAADPLAPITMYLNSPGGEVNSGFAIYDTIRFIRPRVRIVVTGISASIAAVILLAVEPVDRLSMPNARFLLHQPLFNGDVIGPASDLEITANEIMKSRTRINTIIATACNRPVEQVADDTQRDFWLNAEEAVAYGLVSGIVRNMSELA